MKTGIGAIVSLAVTMSGIPLLTAASMNVFVAKDGAQKAALESMTLPSGTLYVSMLPAGSRPSVPR